MRPLACAALLLLASALALAAAPTRPAPAAGTTVPGLRAALRDAGPELRIAVPLAAGRAVELDLRRFSVADGDTRIVVRRAGGVETPLDFDPSSVVLMRGAVTGRPGSSAFLASGPFGVRGAVTLDGERHAIGGGPDGPVLIAPVVGSVQTPPVAVCGVTAPDDLVLASTGPGNAVPGALRRLDVAVETDHEYFGLFGDADAASAYILAMYGAISDIYLRDVDAAVHVSFIRLWETPDDLFNEPNPFGTFASYWEANMGGVNRDVAQLITGRRDLPYGGVAYIDGLCNDNAYSVCGYILGGLADPGVPGSGDWDVVVTAHELGHNCGTFHTHDYGIDDCASGVNQRGTIMSYCHTTAGGTANIDLRFHREIQPNMESFIASVACPLPDCNGNGLHDAFEIAGGAPDANGNGIPDACEDCNANGTLDEDDIAGGASADVDGDGVPDDCQADCDGDGVPDTHQIALGLAEDLNGDEVPDACEADCDGDGASDYQQIQADMALDLDRDAQLDACQDCDGNGTPDLDDLAGSLHLWVGGTSLMGLRQFHGATGVAARDSSGGLIGAVSDVLHDPAGTVLASDSGGRVAEFDSVSGEFLGDRVAAGAGGLADPAGLAFAPDGTLLVADRALGAVLAYDGGGGPLGAFVAAGSGGLAQPHGLAFGPGGDLFVTAVDDLSGLGRVLRYDGATGAFAGQLVTPGAGGLAAPRGLLFKPDGNLLVASGGTNAVLEYDGASGAFLGRFDKGGQPAGFWWLQGPWGLRLSPRGDVVLVSANGGNAAVHAYHLQTGVFMRSFYVLAAEMPGPTGFDVVPASPLDCDLNYRHDACDIAAGLLADLDGDGVPDVCQCPADTDGDLAVDVNDLVAVISALGACPGCSADVNGDGVVDVNDLNAIIVAWGDCS